VPTTARRFLGLTTVLIAGCAADRVVQPAQTIQTSISVFQTQLSLFQSSVEALQSGEQSVMVANNVQRDRALAETRRLQITQDVSEAARPSEVFKALQSQAKVEVAAMTAAPVSAPKFAPVTLPVEQLASVANTVGQLTKSPGTKVEIQYLIGFVNTINKDMSAPKPATPAAGK